MAFNNNTLTACLLEQISDAVISINKKGRIDYISSSCKQLFCDFPLTHHGMLKSIVKEDRSRVTRAVRELSLVNKHTVVQFQLEPISSNQEARWMEASLNAVFEESNQLERVVAVVRDITTRKKIENEWTHLALHDVLTDLPNRRLFDERAAQAIALAKRKEHLVSVIYMDCDNFKLVNDSMGHDIGDELLKAFTERVRHCIRETDTLARVGGDEFIILLTEMDSLEAVDLVVQRIVHSLRDAWSIDGAQISLTPSIGIAVFPHHGKEAKALIKHADIAMYRSKQRGGNQYHYYSPIVV
ncbi:sensor domain-containing diguanylate cyclase [Paenibacillus swuensis]|uniref:sensor domain-containing diguanylate cyclase n=1 Tax=Paenibacillus swuensis TaxID=1178515 RepID=UPI000839AF48|nr:sensor domain-containing diguanylate cyclase [Paenibacillus swuensis]